MHTFLTIPVDRCEWSASCHSYFIHRKKSWYPINGRLDGSQKQSGYFGKDWCGI